MIRRAAVVVCVVAFIGCSSDTTHRSDGSSSSAPTTISVTTTAPTTTTTVPLSPADSPQAAAAAFVNAWRNGDRVAALTIAIAAAVDAVFTAGEPGSLQNRGCNRPPDEGPVLCVYRTSVGELQVRTQPRPDGWIVDQAIVSAA
jgi:hypothetical protein